MDRARPYDGGNVMNAPAREFSLEFIQSMITEQSGRVSGWFNDLELKTVFQPTFSLPHKRAIGFEANLRSSDSMGRPVSPQALFGPVENYPEISMLDMLCTTMHVRSFFTPAPPPHLLLINLHPEVLLDFGNSAKFLGDLLSHYRVSAGKVMIDIPGSVLESPELDDAIAAYRQLGCLIAIDDFGVENANMDTIWHTNPTLVKIDRAMIARAVTDPRIRQMLPKAVSLLHEMGTLVMMEGIESEVEALIALDVDADFGSGFYLGPMLDSISEFGESPELLKNLWQHHLEKTSSATTTDSVARLSLEDEALSSSSIQKLRHASPSEIGRYREERRPFLNAIQDFAARVRTGKPFEISCDEFLALPGAIRCYALNGEGVETGLQVMAPSPPPREGLDFQGMAGRSGANWSRRDFFRRAVKDPGVVQVTRQYCSLTGYTRCVTFSIVVPVAHKPMVICGDVDWTAHAMVRLAPGRKLT